MIEQYEDRAIKVLKLLPKHKGSVTSASKEAGYSESYSTKNQKYIMKTAQKKVQSMIEREKEKLKDIQNKEEIKKSIDTLQELIGISQSDYSNEVKKIALQDKDYSTKFKMLQALSKYTPINLETAQEERQIIPVLNIAIKELNPTLIKPIETKQIEHE